ncbi:MAG: YciI family protein [Rhodospirillaceae bacterium]
MALTPAKVEALYEKMLHKRLYIIFSEPIEKAGDRRKIFHKHIAYQLEIERKGILFAAGPFVDARGKPQGPGMIVVRAKNLAEATRIAEADPFHKQGYRRFRIQAWQVNEGGFNLRVRFSDRTFALD